MLRIPFLHVPAPKTGDPLGLAKICEPNYRASKTQNTLRLLYNENDSVYVIADVLNAMSVVENRTEQNSE